jgi:hypothetical protein
MTCRFQPLVDMAGMPGFMVLIRDTVWWAAWDEIVYDWCITHFGYGGVTRKNTILIFKNAEDRTLFLLKWGG